ncbi:MAG: hypothetical protein M3076_04215 [Actinomycetota bacterium]|nr:hypothetical protein [Actinomycetota bacterium]
MAGRADRVLVYSLCTISRQESRRAEEFLNERSDFSSDDRSAEYPQFADDRCSRDLQLLPPRDRTDGFFIARLRRHD